MAAINPNPKGLCSDIALRLQKVLHDMGWSEREFERRAGLGRGRIGAIRRGSAPAPDALLALAKAANVSVEWLLTGQDQVPVQEVPIYLTGGGPNWVVSDQYEPQAEAIPKGLVGYEVRGDSMEPIARDGRWSMPCRRLPATATWPWSS